MAASVGGLAIQISGNSGPLLRELKYTQNAMTNFGQVINRNVTVNIKEATEKSNGILGGLGGGMKLGALAAGAAAVTAIGVAAVRTGGRALGLAADYQDAATSFEVMTGSMEKGKGLLDDIQKFAAATPFQSKELTENARMLMGFGVELENILPTLKAIGEVTAGAGGGAERLQRISLVYGQVIAKQKFLADDLRQFTEAGVGVQDFASVLGVSVARFRELMEAGKVGSDVVSRAFNKMTGEGGRFNGLMDKLSQNARGRMNAIGENMDLALQEIGLGILNSSSTSDLFSYIENLTARIRANAKEVSSLLSDIAEIAKAGLIGAEVGGKGLMQLLGLDQLDSLRSVKDLVVDIVALMSAIPAMVHDAKVMAEVLAHYANESLHNSVGLTSDEEYAKRMRAVVKDMGELRSEKDLKAFYESLYKTRDAAKGAANAIKEIPAIAVKGGVSTPREKPAYLDGIEKTAKDFADQGRFLERFKVNTIAQLAAGRSDGKGLMTQDAARFGVSKGYNDLKKMVADRLEVKLPSYALKGTSEAQDIINKSMEKSMSIEEEVLRVLQEAKKLQEEMRELEKRQAAALEKLVAKGGIKGAKI